MDIVIAGFLIGLAIVAFILPVAAIILGVWYAVYRISDLCIKRGNSFYR